MSSPRVTICIPHWQVKDYMRLCLRSIRKHSENYDVEVIIVDNGSKDESLDYLRGLDWIRLIERPEEVHTNWPENVFTAWNLGLREATGEYYITMHSDVFIKRDDWLDPFLREMQKSEQIAASGAWKLVLENPIYAWQKQVIGYASGRLKQLVGLKKEIKWKQGHYPRDYCAMYRRDVLLEGEMTFLPIYGQGGGYSIAKQIWDAGYEMGMFGVREMDRILYHVAHGTAAVAPEKKLNHSRAQKKVERKVEDLFQEKWIHALAADDSLDDVRRAA
ncbi:MAG: glycosyltransferase family 2 protein [Planctomycetaceae bacterium]|nr:glycosyltransferase family 2 protein [Planctomycetaceae bacterium]